jgi:hypothetical protein
MKINKKMLPAYPGKVFWKKDFPEFFDKKTKKGKSSKFKFANGSTITFK